MAKQNKPAPLVDGMVQFGIDPASPNGDMIGLSINYRKKMYAYTGEEAKALLAWRAAHLQAAVREAEQRAARKIQAVINAHCGLNSDTEVLRLVEASLQVLDKLKAEAPVNQGEKWMNVTSLELSRQLQERWPEWDKESAEYIYYINGGEYSGQVYYKEMVFNKEGNLPARTLDELRVFALEHMNSLKPYSILWQELGKVLIQGCDPTAEWILNTFGGK